MIEHVTRHTENTITSEMMTESVKLLIPYIIGQMIK